MSEPAPKRRIIMPPAQRAQASPATLVLEPSVNNLMTDALSVIANEIVRFKYKSSKGESLKLEEARVLQGYIRSLVELAKECRERDEGQDLANYTDDQLAELISSLRKSK